MFYGEFEQALETGGRMVMPPPFRADLAQGLVVTRGLDGCLFIYPAAEWERVADAISALPLTRGVARGLMRLILGGASALALDGRGGLVLPEALRRYARLDEGAVIVGAGDRLEVWSQVTWDDLTSRLAAESGDLAESLSQLGFALT